MKMDKIEQAKNNLMKVLIEGRIILNALPLTALELGQLQQSVLLLYDAAKEAEEAKEGRKDKEAE